MGRTDEGVCEKNAEIPESVSRRATKMLEAKTYDVRLRELGRSGLSKRGIRG